MAEKPPQSLDPLPYGAFVDTVIYVRVTADGAKTRCQFLEYGADRRLSRVSNEPWKDLATPPLSAGQVKAVRQHFVETVCRFEAGRKGVTEGAGS